MKKKPIYILLIFAAIALLVYMTGESYYNGIIEKAGLDKKTEKVYQYKYDMIVDSPDSEFWQEVYTSAKKTAAGNDVLLEIMGTDRGTSYNKLDYMKMSIAAKVDGIILQYNGESGLEQAINDAVNSGIPVVTVMSDAVHSHRQSFVGVSDYQLGMAYGEIVSRYVDGDTQQLDMPVRAYAIQSTNTGEDKTTIPEQAAAAYQKYVNQNKGLSGGVTK